MAEYLAALPTQPEAAERARDEALEELDRTQLSNVAYRENLEKTEQSLTAAKAELARVREERDTWKAHVQRSSNRKLQYWPKDPTPPESEE